MPKFGNPAGAPAVLAGLIALFIPLAAMAHGFGRLYNLPVPFWLYAWTTSAVLIVSFMLAAYFARSGSATAVQTQRDITQATWVRALRWLLPFVKFLSVALLVTCLATAFYGNPDPYRNFSMTLFWVVFLLGFTYLTAFIGNLYAVINPWRVIAETVSRVLPRYRTGLLHYPAKLGDWPALVFYLAFIWFELFGLGRPLPLAKMLLGYSIINFVGIGLVGIRAWFRHCEFFAVYLRLIALMSPLDYQPSEAPGERSKLYWRMPFSGLVGRRPGSLSTVVFVLAMLSTTAFDGLRSTQSWVWLFWSDPYGIFINLAGTPPIQAVAALRPWYIAWETLWLITLPLLYFAVYLACIGLAKLAARTPRSLRQLALDFTYPLLPIVFVYHITHYATLMLTQGLKIISLASDPFGWGWDLFGTTMQFRAPILPSMGLVWHAQVGLILAGHIIGVYLSHQIALRVLPSRGRAALGQLPMLILMVLFTLVGLWILAQPLTTERMQ